MKKLLSLLLLFLMPAVYLLAQTPKYKNLTKEDFASHPYWVEMMKDPGVNFYDTQKAFEIYFEGREKGKGTGYKQFMRWAAFMEPRVYPTGERFAADQLWNEMQNYNRRHDNSNAGTRNSWNEMGPKTSQNVTGHWNPGIGRINVIALAPDDPQTIYIGAPSGGLWKTTDEGQNWACLTDNLPIIGVSAIAVDYTNTDILYIGTGDKDAANTYSIGVLKSYDGGQTWDITGLEWSIYQNETIAKLLIHPDDPNTLFAATTYGLMKTTDGGDNWYRTLNGDIDDIEFKPGDPGVVYACTKKLYISTDGGENFEQSQAGLPTNYRVQIAVTEANPEYLYFFSSRDGIYRSEDGGMTFTKRSDNPTPGVQDWYDLSFAASHVNPDEIHCGEFNTHRSLDGGLTWVLTTDWTWGNPIGYTHCDIHEMVFYGGTLYVGSDGLISKSTNSGDDWANLTEGIGIRQFYRIGTSKTQPYMILGGSQDNGTSVHSLIYWHEWLGADGMECVVDWSNPDIVYGTSQGGTFYKSNTGGNFGNINVAQPGSGAWITPFAQHPTQSNTLFVGTNQVQKTTTGMMNWTTISNLNGGNIKALALAESNPDYIYVSKDSKIYRTKDGGTQWDEITGNLPNLYITYIAVHPSDPDMLAVSFSGYEIGKKVFVSENGGDTWENISGDLPNIPANCVTFYDSPDNGLYVGMDVGVYYKDKYSVEWEAYFEGLPNVIVNELEISYPINKIRAATFGRGLWECDVLLKAPTAAFEVSETTIPAFCTLQFENTSSGFNNDYLWNFEGGTPSSSTEENPEVLYETPGIYDVELIVSNETGSDTLKYEDLIMVEETLLPEPGFVADDSVVCLSHTVVFDDLTKYCPTSWNWSFTPNSVVFVNGTGAGSMNPEVEFQEATTYSVTLTVENASGQSTLTKENYIHAGGLLLPFTEDFESGIITANNWTVINDDNDKTWEIATPAFTPDGTYTAMMNFFGYYGISERDQLVSPPLNLSGMDVAALQFIYSYAQRYSQADSLIIYASADCGESWQRIYANGPDGTGIFATAPGMTSYFDPETADDWCGQGYGAACVLLDLADFVQQSGVMIMFESFNRFGNNLYLDDIEISQYVGVGNNKQVQDQMELFPNPATRSFTVQLPDEETALMKIVDDKGFTVMEHSVNGTGHFDVQRLARGVYVVKVVTGRKVFIGKLILQ